MLTQSTRLIVLGLYLGISVLMSYGLYGVWWPPSDGPSIWFYTSVYGLLLSDLLLSPFFTKPCDVVANALVGVYNYLAYRPAATHGSYGAGFWWIGMVWTLGVAIAAIGLMMRGRAVIVESNERWEVIRKVVVELGSAKYVFSLVFIYSIVEFQRTRPIEAAILALFWFSVFTLHPLEFLAERIVEWRSVRNSPEPFAAGFLLARQEPNISLLQSADRKPIGFGVPILINLSADEVQLGMSLDTQWLARETWIRVLRIPREVEKDALADARRRIMGEVGKAVRVPDGDLPAPLLADLGRVRKDFVGLVSTDTDLTTMRFDVLREQVGLCEGQLVRARIGEQDVLFHESLTTSNR